MGCECVETMKNELRSVRNTARTQANKMRKQLDAFQEGIQIGADNLAVAHIYKAGVYLACRDYSMKLEPPISEIENALDKELSSKYPNLFRFFRTHLHEVCTEDLSADKKKMLRDIIKRGQNALGLLSGRAFNEIENAKKALERAERTKERLNLWKQGIKSGVTPELIPIVDKHGMEYISSQ